MTTLLIDIETRATDRTDVIESLKAGIKPPGTFKKPESIAAWMEENIASELDAAHRKTALDGAFGQVLCIGYAIDDEPAKTLISRDETLVLSLFADFLNSQDFDKYTTQIVGHNLCNFDLRFLLQRYIVNQIPVPFLIRYAANVKPWESEKVFDTMTQWAGVGNRISLDKLCLALNIDSPKGDLDGSKVYDYYIQDRLEEIAEYCKRDIEATRQVFKRMK